MLRTSDKRLHIGEQLPTIFGGRAIRRYPATFKASRPSRPTRPPVSGAVGWYDLSDISSLTLSGQLISSVADKSGTGNTATGTNNPMLGIDPGTDRPVMVCTPTGQLDTNVSASDRTSTVFFVAMARIVTASGALYGPGSDGAIELRINSSGQLETLRADVASLAAQSNASVTAGVPFVAAQLITDTDITHYLRTGGSTTSEQDANSTAVTAGQVVRIGRSPTVGSSGEPWTGWIGEALFYDTSLTGTQVTDTIDYLRTKWGIA